jgi:hypothetical protein
MVIAPMMHRMPATFATIPRTNEISWDRALDMRRRLTETTGRALGDLARLRLGSHSHVLIAAWVSTVPCCGIVVH